jgi:hypothetical protein
MKIIKIKFRSFFSNNKKLNLLLKNNNEKITTLFLDKANHCKKI